MREMQQLLGCISRTQLFPTPVSLYGPCFIKVFCFFSPRNSATPVHRLCLVLQLPGLLMWVHAQGWADHLPSTYGAQNCKVEQHSKFAGRFSISFWHCRCNTGHNARAGEAPGWSRVPITLHYLYFSRRRPLLLGCRIHQITLKIQR